MIDLILRNGYIYLVKNEVLANNKIEGRIITKHLKNPHDVTLYYSVNNGPFNAINRNHLVIERSEIKHPYLDLKIKAQSKEGTEVFRSDTLPLTNILVLGERLEDSYTETLKAILNRLDEIDERFRKVEQRLTDLEEVGELI